MSCICCGSEKHRLLYRLRDISFGEPGEWNFVSCLSCGHGFISPLPSNEELRLFYEQLYTKEKKEEMLKMGKGSFDQKLQKQRAQMLFKHAQNPVSRILDVGCGMGFSLGKLKNQWPQAQAIGLELSPVAAGEAAKNSGLDVRNSSIWDVECESDSVDIVTMNHVVEHLQDPKKELGRVYELLSENGLLLIEVPHLTGWGRNWFGRWWWGHLPPQHLHLFKPQGLVDLLKELDFECLELRQHGYPLTLFFTLIVWIRGSFGSYSKWSENPIIRVMGFVLGAILLPMVLVLDLVFTPLMNRVSGDIVTAIFRKK